MYCFMAAELPIDATSTISTGVPDIIFQSINGCISSIKSTCDIISILPVSSTGVYLEEELKFKK